MRALLNDRMDTMLAPPTPTTIVIRTTEGSRNTAPVLVALLALLGLCTLMGITWLITKIFRACKPAPVPPQSVSRDASSLRLRLPTTYSAASLSSPYYVNDLERSSGELTGRSDSMGTRAAAWARAVLAGQVQGRLPVMTPSAKAKVFDTVCIPVKQAVVVLQPDGETSLGVTSEVVFKDAMVQVDEAELAGMAQRVSPRRRKPEQQPVATLSETPVPLAEQQEAPPPFSGDDEAESGRKESSRSLRCAAAAGEYDDDAEDDEESRRRRRRRRRKRRLTTCEASCQTD